MAYNYDSSSGPQIAAITLRDRMMEISEDRYSAQWHMGLEQVLWREARAFQVPELFDLARQANGWWTWPDDAEEPVFVPLSEWVSRFIEGGKPVSIDFDGVIHAYTSPWTSATEIWDGPVDGAFDFLRELYRGGYTIQIHSARANHPDAEAAMIGWFMKHGLEYPIVGAMVISAVKRGALVYIDDHGWRFEGVFPTLAQIHALKQWNR